MFCFVFCENDFVGLSWLKKKMDISKCNYISYSQTGLQDHGLHSMVPIMIDFAHPIAQFLVFPL